MTRKNILLSTIIIICSVVFFIRLAPNTPHSADPSVLSIELANESNKIEATSVYQANTQKVPKEIAKESNEVLQLNNIEDENYILTCQTPLNHEEAYAEEKLKPFHDYLNNSTTPEHQLAAIFFASDTQQVSKLDLLHTFHQEHPMNKLALMELIGLCSENVDHSACSTDLFNRASQIDGDNGALWLQIANYHAAKGNKQATLNAINKVNKANDFDSYYYQYLDLFMSASKGTLDVSDNLRAIAGLGYHAAIAFYIRDFTKFCTSTENLVNDKNQACLALGKILEERGKTRLFSAVGLAIQEKIYQAEGNNPLSTKAKARKEALYNPAEIALHNKAGDLMLRDPKLFQFWLRNGMNYGEHKAINMLIIEVISLSKNKNYNPCSNE